ncbi:MAG TPA: hypothetical protein VKD00_06905 [Methyloceanibacter sp.]|nr:hypothetical protein [Methyloceanibacter sp.]
MSTCFVCGAHERVVPVMRPVLDEKGEPIFVFDETLNEPVPKMQEIGYRMVMEHDPIKHGIKQYGRSER